MRGLDIIYDKKLQIAVILRSSILISGVNFFTSKDNPLQIGIHQNPKGTKLQPHFHVRTGSIEIKKIQEVLVVQRGKIRVTLYSKKGKIIAKKILSEGDLILLMEDGHGVDFIKDSQIYIIKQGPFLNTLHQKIFIRSNL